MAKPHTAHNRKPGCRQKQQDRHRCLDRGIRTKKEQVVLSTVVVDGKSEYVRIDKDELVLPAKRS